MMEAVKLQIQYESSAFELFHGVFCTASAYGLLHATWGCASWIQCPHYWNLLVVFPEILKSTIYQSLCWLITLPPLDATTDSIQILLLLEL